jgi:hypothetical protein
MVRWFVLAGFIAVAASGCGGGSSADALVAHGTTDSGRHYYSVTYVDVNAYDATTDQAAIARCAALPGAKSDGARAMLPPIRTLSVSGSVQQVRDFEECLRGVPNAVVSPFDMADAPDATEK